MQQHKSVLFRLFHFTFASVLLTLLTSFATIWLLDVPESTGAGLRTVLLVVQGILPVVTYIVMRKTARMIYLQAYMSVVLLLAVFPLFLFFYYGLLYPPVLVWGCVLIASLTMIWVGYGRTLRHLKKFEYRLAETDKYNPETGIWNVLKPNPGDPDKEPSILKIAVMIIVTYVGFQGLRLFGMMIPSLGVILIFLGVFVFLLVFIWASASGLAVCRIIKDIENRDGVEIKV